MIGDTNESIHIWPSTLCARAALRPSRTWLLLMKEQGEQLEENPRSDCGLLAVGHADCWGGADRLRQGRPLDLDHVQPGDTHCPGGRLTLIDEFWREPLTSATDASSYGPASYGTDCSRPRTPRPPVAITQQTAAWIGCRVGVPRARGACRPRQPLPVAWPAQAGTGRSHSACRRSTVALEHGYSRGSTHHSFMTKFVAGGVVRGSSSFLSGRCSFLVDVPRGLAA